MYKKNDFLAYVFFLIFLVWCFIFVSGCETKSNYFDDIKETDLIFPTKSSDIKR